jgi:hypothetical protein
MADACDMFQANPRCYFLQLILKFITCDLSSSSHTKVYLDMDRNKISQASQ